MAGSAGGSLSLLLLAGAGGLWLMTLGGWLGAAQILGAVAGTGLATAAGGIAAGYVACAVFAAAGVLPYILRYPDLRLETANRPPWHGRSFLRGFWLSPRRYPDFGWAWLTRFLINLSNALVILYLLYYLRDRLRYDDPEQGVLILTAVNSVTLPATVVGGVWSDRVGRRKPFVRWSGALMAAATALLAAWQTWPGAIVVAALLGLTLGVFMSVDFALMTDVLPKALDRGKDLGVINVANALPQVAAPAVAAPIVTHLGGYRVLYLVAAVIAVAGALLVGRIRSVDQERLEGSGVAGGVDGRVHRPVAQLAADAVGGHEHQPRVGVGAGVELLGDLGAVQLVQLHRRDGGVVGDVVDPARDARCVQDAQQALGDIRVMAHVQALGGRPVLRPHQGLGEMGVALAVDEGEAGDAYVQPVHPEQFPLGPRLRLGVGAPHRPAGPALVVLGQQAPTSGAVHKARADLHEPPHPGHERGMPQLHGRLVVDGPGLVVRHAAEGSRDVHDHVHARDRLAEHLGVPQIADDDLGAQFGEGFPTGGVPHEHPHPLARPGLGQQPGHEPSADLSGRPCHQRQHPVLLSSVTSLGRGGAARERPVDRGIGSPWISRAG